MNENLPYRRTAARIYIRLFRPVTLRGPRSSRFDQMTARWWTRLDILAFRRLGVSLGVRALGIEDVLLLRTRGHGSGRVREVLVAYVDIDGVPHVCAANGGSDREPAWFTNLCHGGPVEVERHGRRRVVVPQILEGAERERCFDYVYHAFPHVRLYLEHTSRLFPVVRLSPVEPPDLGVADRSTTTPRPAPVVPGLGR